MFDQLLANLASGRTTTGAVELDGNQISELNKAITAGYGTDMAALTGGGAFRIQSLDKTMQATIQENKHFRLFNALAKTNAGATVDEWTEQSAVGGFLGGSTNTETGSISAAQGVYARRTALVKYLMTRREVSFVSTLGNNIVQSETVEQQAGAKQLLTDAEFLSFEGDSAVVPTEFDGIYAQMVAGVAASQVDSGNIIDLAGGPLNGITPINNAAAQVSAMNNYGTPTHIFCSQLAQSDFDSGLDPAFRVPLTDVPGGGISLGSPVRGIRTSWGDIANMTDVFVRDEQNLKPFQIANGALATANTGMKPTLAVDPSVADATSKFVTGVSDGNYYYLVTGVSAAGESDGVISTSQAVANGKKVTLTITVSAGGLETGYGIYRSRRNGTNTASDFRLIKRIPRTGASTTYVDFNIDLPGTTKAYILDMLPGDTAINWRQLLPMMRFQLYPTVAATLPWAQLLFGYLRMTKRRMHAVIKNIVPSGSVWKPYGSIAT